MYVSFAHFMLHTWPCFSFYTPKVPFSNTAVTTGIQIKKTLYLFFGGRGGNSE
jgi:hypothetical protein